MVNNARWLTAALKRKLTELQDRYIQECMAKILDETTDGDANYRLIKTHFAYSKYLTTLKQSYKRPPHILSSSSESKIRSIKIHDHMNKPMSNSGSVSFCIPKCVILLTQTKHV